MTGFHGADEQARTADLLITNQLLYQLSYVGVPGMTSFFVIRAGGPGGLANYLANVGLKAS